MLDTGRESVFDTLVQLASEACGAPIALVSLVDAHRQWFKAKVGLDGVDETARDVAFCDHTIRQGDVFVVEDARSDARFAANPMVTGDPSIRFYAGAPLVLAGGERVGTLCVIDHAVRGLSPRQAAMLQQLARVAVQTLEMRRDLLRRAVDLRGARQQGVAESAARLRAILDAQQDLVSQSRADGTLLYVNPAYAAHFGRRVDQIIGTSLYDYVEADDRAEVRARIDEVLQGGRRVASENRMRRPDGRECWVAWTNSRQEGPGGEPMLHSTGRDVTEAHHAQQALKAHQALLARTERLARTGGWTIDLASGRLDWSAEARRMLEAPDGFQPTAADALDIYLPEGRRLIEQAARRAIADGEPWDLELELVTMRGRRFWGRAIGAPEREGGRTVRLVGAFQDVSERHALEQRLADSERFSRRLADELPVRVAYLDRDRRYRFVNREWCRVAGVEREAAIGRTRAELFPRLPDTEFGRRAEVVLRGEPVRFEYDELVGGETRRFENRLIPDLDDEGRARGFFVAGIDVTDRDAGRKTAQEIAAIFDATSDYVLQWDGDGTVRYANRSARDALGLDVDAALPSLRIRALMTEATARLLDDEVLPALRTQTLWLGQVDIDLPGRLALPVSLMAIAHRDPMGGVARYSAVMRDVSRDVAARQEVLRQTATLRSVADAFPSNVAVLDVAGRYRFVNRAFAASVGRSAVEVVGRGAREVVGEAEYVRRRPWIERALGGETVHFELDHDGVQGRMHTAFEYIPLRLPSGELDGFVVVSQDVTERRREESRLQALSQTDPLTGLLNRAGFDQRVDNTLATDDGGCLGLLYVDLDRFKPVNDTHGHGAGDRVLKEVARRLARRVRPSDAIARLGGDEFALLLPGLRDPRQLDRIGQQIVRTLAEPMAVSTALSVTIGASVGGVVGPALRSTWTRMLERADQLLYQAKREGRGRCVVEVAEAAEGG